jgi:hypothetical protein
MASTIRLPVPIRHPTLGGGPGEGYWHRPYTLIAHEAGIYAARWNSNPMYSGQLVLPADVAATPNAKIKLYCSSAGTTGDVGWNFNSKGIALGEALNFTGASWTSEALLYTTVPATAHQIFQISIPASGNLGSILEANDLFRCTFARSSAAEDTLESPIIIHEVILLIDVEGS